MPPQQTSKKNNRPHSFASSLIPMLHMVTDDVTILETYLWLLHIWLHIICCLKIPVAFQVNTDSSAFLESFRFSVMSHSAIFWGLGDARYTINISSPDNTSSPFYSRVGKWLLLLSDSPNSGWTFPLLLSLSQNPSNPLPLEAMLSLVATDLCPAIIYFFIYSTQAAFAMSLWCAAIILESRDHRADHATPNFPRQFPSVLKEPQGKSVSSATVQ